MMTRKTIDLRSDTITQPSPAMREAMYRAEVGDDVLREDPTVIRLEERAAAILGKEAALFVASGTMGNLVALLSHCQRGEEFIVGHRSHICLLERGGSAMVGGIFARSVQNQPDGSVDPVDIEKSISPPNIHFSPTRLVCIENPHNRCAGRVLSLEKMQSIVDVAKKHGMALHLDGARIFNAAVALGVAPRDVAREMHSVMFCLAKGAAAPAGALLCASRPFIERAREIRQVLGGGMAKVGVLAAAGIVALDEYHERIVYDHQNARLLGEGIGEIPSLSIDLESVQTNVVVFEIRGSLNLTAEEFAAKVEDEGVRITPVGPYRVKAFTHHGVGSEDIQQCLRVFQHVIRNSG
jgi:threonine aldolase